MARLLCDAGPVADLPDDSSPGALVSGIVVSQTETLQQSLSSVGGKAVTLARLGAGGLQVPEFFVVRAEAFAQHLAANRIPWPADGDAGDRLGATRRAINEAPLPTAIDQAIGTAYRRLVGAGLVAVRSSGAEEDSADSSFAGQFRSFLGVRGHDAVASALRSCWASYLAEGAWAYRRARGVALPAVPHFGVVVQRQVMAERAGVMHTVHPLLPGGGVALIEANFGTGESVVDGAVNPDSIEFSRASGQLLSVRVARKSRMSVVAAEGGGSTLVQVAAADQEAPVLTDAQARAVFEAGRVIEELLGAPQDIEWAFDSQGLWILQSRPLTAPALGLGFDEP